MSVEIFPIGDRAAWLERRRSYLNASDIACLFGVHRHKTLAQLVAQMRGLEGLEADSESPLIRRGNALEDDAADEVRKLHPTWNIFHCEHQYIDKEARIAATPDYIVVDPNRSGNGALQIKVVSSPIFKRDWADSPPLSHLLQLSTEMMLLQDCSWGAIGALIIGDHQYDCCVYPVERNRGAEARLRSDAAQFWRAFDAGEHPAINFERDGALIALLYPTAVRNKTLDLTGDNRIGELLEKRERLRNEIKQLETECKTTETEIKAKIADAESAVTNGWRISFKTQHRKAHWVSESSSRVLRATRLPSNVRTESEGLTLIADREKSTPISTDREF